MKFLQKLKLSNLLYNKKFTAILSVVLAFALWLGIAMTENPIRQQTFNDLSATVTLEGTAAADLGLGIVSDISSQKFSVTVSGPNYLISSLKPDDFSLSVSTTSINTADEHTLDVQVSTSITDPELKIKSVSPSTVTLKVDFIDTAIFEGEKFIAKLIGVSPSDGLVAETPIISDLQQRAITVRGPRSTVEKIASVVAYKEVNETLSNSATFDANIVLYDNNEKIIYRYTSDGTVYDANDNVITNSFLSLSFTSVKVTQPISKKKTVPCKAVFSNLPSTETAENIKYNLSNKNVTIIGTPEIVDKIEEITLSPIDIREVSKASSSFEVAPILPDGVRLFDNIQAIDVGIDVSKHVEKTFEIKNIRCKGLSDELKAKTGKSISVKICGPQSVIKNIKASDLYAVLDLTDKAAGEYAVDVDIKSDVFDNFWQIGKYTASVTIY